ncbi:MAG: hypothetical protein KIT79_15635 [Deltaproteobacteria bacterium]|nr:hypothetical protein [Deltaproteobacteria bacterium]
MTELLILIVCAGALGLGVCRVIPGQNWPVRFGLAWGCGLGLSGYLLMLFVWSGIRLAFPSASVICGIALGAGLFLWKPWTQKALDERAGSGSLCRDFSPLEWIAVAVVAGTALAILLTVLSTPVKAFDARMIWMFHARLIADTGIHPAPELHDPAFVIGHPQYPPLLPVLQALAAILSGVFDERWVRLVPAGFYFAMGGLLWDSLKDAPQRLLLVSAWALMPTLVVFEEGGADSGLADVMLSFYVFASLWLALKAEGRLPQYALAGACAAFAGLTKNEGLVIAGMVAVVLWSQADIPFRAKLVFVATWILMLVPWLAVRGQIATLFEERYLEHLTPGRLLWGLDRAGLVAGEMARQMFLLPQRSGLFWWLILAWFAGSERRRDLLLVNGLWIVPAYLLVIYVLYLVTPWERDFQVHLSFSRVLLHIAPLALWAAVWRPDRRVPGP